MVGGAVLPWCAVLIANNGPVKKRVPAPTYRPSMGTERALTAGDDFVGVDIAEVFGFQPTPFDVAIRETFGHPTYSAVALAVTVGLLGALLRRVGIGSVLRMGED